MKNKNKKQLSGSCSACGSQEVDFVTRVTGYFSKTSMWNKGKLAELRDRDKNCNILTLKHS
jgi:ribonucleoside-triphosphate reductase